jgi:hypothetical protein
MIYRSSFDKHVPLRNCASRLPQECRTADESSQVQDVACLWLSNDRRWCFLIGFGDPKIFASFSTAFEQLAEVSEFVFTIANQIIGCLLSAISIASIG